MSLKVFEFTYLIKYTLTRRSNCDLWLMLQDVLDVEPKKNIVVRKVKAHQLFLIYIAILTYGCIMEMKLRTKLLN